MARTRDGVSQPIRQKPMPSICRRNIVLVVVGGGSVDIIEDL